MSEPEFFLPFLRSKIKPEVLHAIKVILGAILEDVQKDPLFSGKEWANTAEPARDVEAHREDFARRERIRRAERAVATRRKNAKKKKAKVVVWKKKRSVNRRDCSYQTKTGKPCVLHRGHAGRHVTVLRPAKKGSSFVL